jgi:hypothetical protein
MRHPEGDIVPTRCLLAGMRFFGIAAPVAIAVEPLAPVDAVRFLRVLALACFGVRTAPSSVRAAMPRSASVRGVEVPFLCCVARAAQLLPMSLKGC